MKPSKSAIYIYLAGAFLLCATHCIGTDATFLSLGIFLLLCQQYKPEK